MSSLFLFFTAPLHAKTTTECINRVVWAEARGESREGQRAVAHVILNRSKQSGRTPCEVVSSRGQFVQGRPPSSFSIGELGSDPTGGATHFKTRDARRWYNLRKYIRIGGHTFYGK